MRYKPVWRSLCRDLSRSFPKCQRLGLSENVCHQHVVMTACRMDWFNERDEIAGNQARSLMDQLIEGMLAVGSVLAPIDRACRASDLRSIKRHSLPITFHDQLLQISGESFEVLLIRQNGYRLSAEEIVVPDVEESHQDRQIPLERRTVKVFVDLLESIQHFAEMIGPDRNHRRKTDCRVHRVSSSNPVPELKHVAGIDTELRHFLLVRRHSNKMPGHRFL